MPHDAYKTWHTFKSLVLPWKGTNTDYWLLITWCTGAWAGVFIAFLSSLIISSCCLIIFPLHWWSYQSSHQLTASSLPHKSPCPSADPITSSSLFFPSSVTPSRPLSPAAAPVLPHTQCPPSWVPQPGGVGHTRHRRSCAGTGGAVLANITPGLSWAAHGTGARPGLMLLSPVLALRHSGGPLMAQCHLRCHLPCHLQPWPWSALGTGSPGYSQLKPSQMRSLVCSSDLLSLLPCCWFRYWILFLPND